MTDKTPKRPRGRPVEKPMPEPIPDTPENIARAVLAGPPKKNWDYLKDADRRDRCVGRGNR